MPKFKCECGDILSYSEIPCKIEYKFISDLDYDRYEGEIDAEELYGQMRSFIKCEKCNRLWIFWNGFGNEPLEYIQVKK